MVPAVISKIISMQPSFTMSENEIGQYVIKNTEFVLSSTITTIAKATNTSEASINRFCKKLGYKGFNGLKIALVQENFYNNMKKHNDYSAAEVGYIESLTMDYRQMLMNTSAMINEDTLNSTVELIKSSKDIHIFALFGFAFIAHELEFKLNAIGLSTKAHTDVLDMRISVSNIKPHDLAIVIAPTILVHDIYQAVNTCRENHAKIVTITSYDSPKLNDIVDCKFITSDKVAARNSMALSNNLMFLYVIDLIYGALLKSDKTLLQKKIDSDAILNSYQAIDNYMFEY